MTPQRPPGRSTWLIGAVGALVLAGVVLAQTGVFGGRAVPSTPAVTPPATGTATSGTTTPGTPVPTSATPVSPAPPSTPTSPPTIPTGPIRTPPAEPTTDPTPTGPGGATVTTREHTITYRATSAGAATISYGPIGEQPASVAWPGGEWTKTVDLTAFDATVLLSVEGEGARTCEILLDGTSVVRRQAAAGVPALCAANTKSGG